MKRICVLLFLGGFALFSWTVRSFGQPVKGNKDLMFTFEDTPAGEIPQGWKIEATRQHGPLATWKVVIDKTAPVGEKVLSLTKTNHHSVGTFNLCWDPSISFQNGKIEVMLKANTGKTDQGGGVLWRATDKNNYYVARFNPLENNFRLYAVKNGNRKMLASANVSLPAGKWINMKIVQQNDRITCYLNDKKYLEVTDHTFTDPGGVGLWTRADAVTSFDNLHVVVLKKIQNFE